jgi:hypothetical protein
VNHDYALDGIRDHDYTLSRYGSASEADLLLDDRSLDRRL